MRRFLPNWRFATVAVAVLSLLVLHLVLIQPNHPHAVAWRALLLKPLELPVIVLALLALGMSRVGWVVRACIVAALTLIAALKGADFGMFVALSRGFNPVSDFPLILSLYQLVVGAFGAVLAVLMVIAAIAAVIAIAALLWWACGVWARMPLADRWRKFAGVGATVAAVVMIADIGATKRWWSLPFQVPGAAFTARVGVERYTMVTNTLAELRAFRTAAATDEFAQQPGLFDLVDRDVLIVFVESYGRTSLDTPFYADLHRASLETAEADLAEAGLSMASTILTSPTRGGQSWLSHATVANGLWIDNQVSYGAALNSGRQTVFHLAADAGFHTAAVMPQITLDWPESQFMGFDTILAAADLGYQGQPFNWVTMPDQFTFAAYDRLLKDQRTDDTPLFVQIATGSSHAPWVPVPEVLAWDALGDGTVFDPLVEASDPPSVVWKDHDRVRAQYRLAVDYALQTVFAYAALHADDPPLMLVIGDHQAAGFVALDERPDVPMHVIGPAHLVDLVADDGFAAGLIPPEETPVRPMDEIRAHLLRSLSSAMLADAPQ